MRQAAGRGSAPGGPLPRSQPRDTTAWGCEAAVSRAQSLWTPSSVQKPLLEYREGPDPTGPFIHGVRSAKGLSH